MYRATHVPMEWTDDPSDHRPDGFYWVRLGQNQPEVGCWQRREWWFCGDDRSCRSASVEVLSERLVTRPVWTAT